MSSFVTIRYSDEEPLIYGELREATKQLYPSPLSYGMVCGVLVGRSAAVILSF